MSLFHQHIDPEGGEKPPIPEDENAVLEKFAKFVVKKRMAVPAILFIESGRPLNYIASQMLVMAQPVAEPMVQMFFNFQEYDVFRRAMERRENVENLLQKIEKYDAEMYRWEKKLKKYTKAEKKNWKWYQRYLGFNAPGIRIPDDLRPPYEQWEKPPEEDQKSTEE